MKAAGSPNFKITGEMDNPSRLDYDILGLYKKPTIIKGELVLVEYYRNYDGVTYSDLVIKETRQYLRDPQTTLAYKRIQTSTWYMEDDSIGLELTFEKYYPMPQSIDEAIRRRSNIIGEAKIFTLYNIGLANSQDYMMALSHEINLYINGATQYMYDAVTNSTQPYITQEIRDGIMLIIYT